MLRMKGYLPWLSSFSLSFYLELLGLFTSLYSYEFSLFASIKIFNPNPITSFRQEKSINYLEIF